MNPLEKLSNYNSNIKLKYYFIRHV